MSRHIAIFALVAFCLSTVVVAEEDTTHANREFLLKQKAVYELLWHVDQPEKQPQYYTEGQAYSIEDNLAHYTHEEYVKEFLALYKAGKMLPRGEIFSVFYPPMAEQAKALFRVFYYSKDSETLFKTAAWARIYMNEGLFTYAFSVAVTHHKDTQKIRVPAHHEIYPHLFFDNGVIRQAYNAKTSTAPEGLASGDWTIIPERNYSSYKFHDSNYLLRYFTDDIALNDFPYYTELGHPFWMSADEHELISARRGEEFFWRCRLQLARYYMERLSNDLGDIKDFDWHQVIPYGFTPSLSFHNGFAVPHREGYSSIESHNYKSVKALRDYEYRISAAIDMGYVILENGTFFPILTPEGIDILGDLFEGNVDSTNFDLYDSYDRVSRSVLGFSPEPFNAYKVFPSLMQQYGLDQRDPIYWSMIKRFVGFYEQFMSKFPKYTSQELAFPGVKVESVSVDRVTTYFTHYDYFISGAVKLYNADDKALIKARQNRLTHKPFTYTIKVFSESDAPKSIIRTFLGPKYDHYHQVIDITENWKHFIVFDEFEVDLKAGSNVFERNSTKTRFGVPDELSGDLFYEKIIHALAGDDFYPIPKNLYGYPNRMFIPKGKKEGFPLQFLVFVSPYNGKEYFHSKSPIFGHQDFVDVPLGFPLDRPVFSNFTYLPNAYFQEFNVFHVEESDLNTTF